MTSLLILASALVVAWLWASWKRETTASFMRDWSYVLLVVAVTCLVMAIGLRLR